jgi:uncharacterized protein
MPLALTDLLNRGDSVEGALRGAVPIKAFPRLAQTLSDCAGSVETDIRVSRASSGVPLVEGSLRGTFWRECQRCLEPVSVDVAVDLRLAITAVGGEELAPQGFEPWQSEASDITLRDLLEDELLLALPMVPRHDDETRCGRLAERLRSGGQEDLPASENPFAVLRRLKRD